MSSVKEYLHTKVELHTTEKNLAINVLSCHHGNLFNPPATKGGMVFSVSFVNRESCYSKLNL